MDRLFKNLRLMDSRVEDSKRMHREGATIQTYSLHESEELMRALVERRCYDAVDMTSSWSKSTGYIFEVSVWWND